MSLAGELQPEAGDPGRATAARWRIVTSAKHSTVWDGAEMLFEFNFLAFGVPADECFKRAFEGGTVLPPGKFRRTYTTPHYSVEIENLRKARSQCPLV